MLARVPPLVTWPLQCSLQCSCELSCGSAEYSHRSEWPLTLQAITVGEPKFVGFVKFCSFFSEPFCLRYEINPSYYTASFLPISPSPTSLTDILIFSLWLYAGDFAESAKSFKSLLKPFYLCQHIIHFIISFYYYLYHVIIWEIKDEAISFTFTLFCWEFQSMRRSIQPLYLPAKSQFSQQPVRLGS